MNLDQIHLENAHLALMPLSLENYHNILPIAMEPELVKYSPSDIESESALQHYVIKALEERDQEKSIPFIIYSKVHKAYAGCTRYMHIDWNNKVLHIGSTWIGRAFHGTGLNTQMKILMIDYAFEQLQFEKVEFRIDERNIRSRKAVEKLGAKLEGILRKNVYLLDGYKRNTCCYGILPEEWKLTKIELTRQP